jgi:beta-glucosidase
MGKGFPDGFLWGAASASYQIEGSALLSGGGASVWDMFCRRPGKIFEGESGEVACDHFRRYREDVSLMGTLGIRNYRFSLSWPRILPTGTGQIHEEGLVFYDRLVDALLEANVEPHITLFHWDFPYELYLKGGWLNRESADWFAEYTQVVVDRLGDRVGYWMTLNEPQCFIGLGHLEGLHAPGDKLGLREALLAGHHALLAHGKGCQVLRARSKRSPKIGWAPVGVCSVPATETEKDIEAARKATFEVSPNNVWSMSWWNDPVFFGTYPEDGIAAYGGDAPIARADDMETICQPLDFLGANIYNAPNVRAGADGRPETLKHESGIGRTLYHWPVTPRALYWGPKFAYERYGKPIVITENGLGLSDWVALDGRVHDPQRIDFLDRYLQELRRASEDGVEIAGYFHWSLTDNFEWHEGYKHRFGLIHVDYATQVRTPKDSAHWYSEVIQSNGGTLGG